MSDAASWQTENTRHLASAIGLVRTRLEQRSGAPPQLTTTQLDPTTKKQARSLWQHISRGRASAPLKPEVILLPGDTTGAKADSAATDQDDEDNSPPALVTLCRRLKLTRFERDLLLLCVGMELDTSIAGLCARAQGDPARPYPTFALALSLFDDPAWDALSPERGLRYWRLIEISQPSGQPLTASALRADEWVTNYLKGLAYLDDRLTALVTPMALSGASETASPSQQDAAAAILERLKQAPSEQPLPVIQLVGADSESKHVVAGLVCGSLGVRVYRLVSSLLPSAPADLESFVRLWQRASLLLPVALYIDIEGESGQTQQAAIDRLLDRLGGIVLLDTREPHRGLGQHPLAVDVGKPSPAEQKAAWADVLGEAGGSNPASLAGQFSLNLASIRAIAGDAVAASAGADPAERLWDACLATTRPRLDSLAQRIVPKATWDDIVLPAPDIALLRQIADQVGQRSQVYQDWGFDRKMSRGLGISALFAGESGTGKTMAAEVIANHLRLNLYRIDLAAVVSKYIGETEKNLRRLFDAAEDGGAILFFDEADALFGKRSEVKDSHDRYANIEINYLLQRMESYGGLAILATNMKSALDTAFLRRLRFVVNFAFPSVAERKAIWQRVFPAQTPTAGLDFDRLARLNVTGGHIALIALNAAFTAAQSKSDVTMPVVLNAARTEFRKLERTINEADFRWPHGPVRAA
jgi:hypothetical protein